MSFIPHTNSRYSINHREGMKMKLEALRSKIAAVTMEEIRVAVIEDEITLLQSRLEPHDTGHLHTAISVLAHRLVELKKTDNETVT